MTKIGYKQTEEHKRNESLAMKGKVPWVKGKKMGEFRDYGTGPNSTNWKGDKVGYSGLHKWVRIHKPIPEKCTKCEEVKSSRKLQASNISGQYKRDLNDWEYLCSKCHVYKDGTVKNLTYRTVIGSKASKQTREKMRISQLKRWKIRKNI